VKLTLAPTNAQTIALLRASFSTTSAHLRLSLPMTGNDRRYPFPCPSLINQRAAAVDFFRFRVSSIQ
ncbi:hypothetical protein, partial [uncultured Tateyamaria sp.]|uniref:hypothetical protein n=1 Tax=uncultured Tateyamaria sp. TaxID=455651 RepID=UPI00260F5020